jgi:hypothetical protein
MVWLSQLLRSIDQALRLASSRDAARGVRLLAASIDNRYEFCGHNH